MSIEDINEITTAVVSKIQEKYFLVEKNISLSADFSARDAFIELVISEASKYFNTTKELLLSYKYRTRLECGWSGGEIKGIIANICREVSKGSISFYVIGKVFGRSHASIKYDFDTSSGFIETNLAFKKDYVAILEIVKSKIAQNT